MSLESKMARPPIAEGEYNFVHGFLPPLVNAVHGSNFPEQMIATLCHSLLLELEVTARIRALDYIAAAVRDDFN